MVEFYICAKKLEFDEINSRLEIFNSSIREGSSFSIKEFAKDYWSINTGYEISADINIQIQKVYDRIVNKVTAINKIRENYNAETGFVITVKNERNTSLPAIYYEHDFIKFAANIGADINMDFI